MPDTRTARKRFAPLALVAAVGVGAAIRLHGLGATPLNFDESFTAMVGRLPVGSVFGFLRAHDSHPPLDYLLQLPLARIGASPFWFRLPSVACSIGALALFAWWMRDRGWVGIIATAAMAICAFQIEYGREARMYGPMELIGVATAIVAEAWLRAPRRVHLVEIGALTFVGLMTHVSMVLMAIGLLALAGVRRDSGAWRWRAAVGAGVAGWALLWGRAFVTQSHGGHSSWIPHTTAVRFVNIVSQLVTYRAGAGIFVVAAIIGGSIICARRDRQLAAVLACCFVIPVVLAGLIGLRAPVLLDRTLAVAAWGPLLALAFLVDELRQRAPVLAVAAVAIAAITMLSSMPAALDQPGPTAALAELEHVARSGDVLAIQPPAKGVELDWTLAIRSDDGSARSVQLPGIHNAVALALTDRRPSGRIWLMQLTSEKVDLPHYRLCAPTWHHGPSRMLCIRHTFASGFPRESKPTITAIYRNPPPSRRVAGKA